MPRFSPYARAEWLTILVVGVLLTASAAMVGLWWLGLFLLPLALLGVYTFRDPDRNAPTQRNVAVSPADGKVVSVHDVDAFAPFDDQPATCVRVYLSLLDVHVQRNPCHGKVAAVKRRRGKFHKAMNPASLVENEAATTLLVHPIKGHPVAAVRQIAGMVARTVVTTADKGDVLQRGQRLGLIKLGSMVELYLPAESVARVAIAPGQPVVAGETIVAELLSPTKVDEDASVEKHADTQAETPVEEPAEQADGSHQAATEPAVSAEQAEPDAEGLSDAIAVTTESSAEATLYDGVEPDETQTPTAEGNAETTDTNDPPDVVITQTQPPAPSTPRETAGAATGGSSNQRQRKKQGAMKQGGKSARRTPSRKRKRKRR